MTFTGLPQNPAGQDGFLTLDLPRAQTCGALARDFLRAQLSGQVSEPALDEALLVTTELVANALRHGEGAIALRLRGDDDRLRVEVLDEGTGATSRVCVRVPDATGGWGLHIVEDISLRWGCFEGTTHVWAEIALSG
jgi:anti-sigma regulatory factor (Ser/Thr protein kinase)